jgi:hypothetical protein
MASMVSSNGSVIKGGDALALLDASPPPAIDQQPVTGNDSNSAATEIDWSSTYAALMQSNAGDLVAMLSQAAAANAAASNGERDTDELLEEEEEEEEDDMTSLRAVKKEMVEQMGEEDDEEEEIDERQQLEKQLMCLNNPSQQCSLFLNH